MPAVGDHLIAKYFVVEAIFKSVDESSLLRLDPIEELKLDEQDSVFVNSTLNSPKAIVRLPTTDYADSPSENDRNRRDLSTVFNDQDNEFVDNKLTNLYSVSVNRDPRSDNKLANKKYVDDSLGEDTVPTFNQSMQYHLNGTI